MPSSFQPNQRLLHLRLILVLENDTVFGKIIAKAWRDPAFKAELIANPAAALKAEGIDVPAGMAVTVLENTDKQFHLVLPPKPTGELSDGALDGVAGGYSGPWAAEIEFFYGRSSPSRDLQVPDPRVKAFYLRAVFAGKIGL